MTVVPFICIFGLGVNMISLIFLGLWMITNIELFYILCGFFANIGVLIAFIMAITVSYLIILG